MRTDHEHGVTPELDPDTDRTQDEPPDPKHRFGGLRSQVAASHAFITLGLFIVLCVVVSVLEPIFLDPDNLLNILRQSSIVVIVAAAGTMVMVSGGFDLSVGAVVALAGVVAAQLAVSGWPIPLVILGAIVAGAFIGLINGMVIVGFRVTPIIATLGALYIAQGLAYIVSGGQAVVVGIPESFLTIGQSYVGPVPTPVIIAIVVTGVLWLVLHRTLLGKYAYAIGGNTQTAELSGVPVARVQTVLYVISGAAAGLGGVILASRLGSGQPGAAENLIFEVVIAIVLGGTALSGGIGTIHGTVIGALFVSVLGNGLNLLGVQTFYQYLVLGTVLVLAVMLDVALKGEGPKLSSILRRPVGASRRPARRSRP
jgi:ribose transport system permease protein